MVCTSRVTSAPSSPSAPAAAVSTVTSSCAVTLGLDSCGFTKAPSCAIAATMASAAAVIPGTSVPVTARPSPPPVPRMLRLLDDRALICTPGTADSWRLTSATSSAWVKSRTDQSGSRTTIKAPVPPPVPMMLCTAAIRPSAS